jgi:glycosyltransferase involved in cell wall biosynthesis
MDSRVTMGLLFYPRGGSAQVVRYLAPALGQVGWRTRLVCGSLGEPGERTNAATFFDGFDLRAADYGPALAAYAAGEDPIAHSPMPLHPSFEDRPDVPDRIFAAVSPELGDHLAEAWRRFIVESDGEAPDMIHLHHLSPLQEAFAAAYPDTPMVTHLHGTDMKMIDAIDKLSDAELEARGWPHGRHWAQRLRDAAAHAQRFIVISPHDRDEAARLLPTVSGDDVEWIPNGVDTTLFDRRGLSTEERLARWREWLVEDGHGWDESGQPGSIRHTDEQLAAFADPDTGEPNPVLVFVGRFLDFKRVPLLVRAYARARERFDRRAPLVIWGGFPGEWEGDHPYEVAREVGERDIFFVGWRGHSDLARGLPCADVMVAPSQNEPFGQVFLEAMACGLPVIATRSGGPLSFVNTEPEPNGWFVDVDSEEQLADALVEAVKDDAGRHARSDAAYEQIRSRYSWDSLADRFAAVYEEAARASR